ncbi:hypothetical protein [Nguyenibacter vanlangensis]|uniref:Uncharacterized protein n=1 Tax=Nguyenibacter vanlangensis TaxID=1216886 RepID=A0A7Y7M6N1_9PROT|nr:hypothetical protein [Nguyenibacter vanlangensis]NVN10568.1 hypothetical protein [Nguyenibacter vanlangensis]
MTDKQTTAGTSLDQALAVFGYSDAIPSHQRYTLISSIALFSALNGRPEIGVQPHRNWTPR